MKNYKSNNTSLNDCPYNCFAEKEAVNFIVKAISNKIKTKFDVEIFSEVSQMLQAGSGTAPGTPDGLVQFTINNSRQKYMVAIQVVRAPIRNGMKPSDIISIIDDVIVIKILKSQKWLWFNQDLDININKFVIFVWCPIELSKKLLKRIHSKMNHYRFTFDIRFCLRLEYGKKEMFPPMFARNIYEIKNLHDLLYSYNSDNYKDYEFELPDLF
uniref:Uncharacterized protein n=1 Tax=viral metagenome TaxID=1070528 RepID=A0A6C0EE65_9ZZZZ